MTQIPKIDLAWEAVNALGGAPAQTNDYDCGFVDAIARALDEIEKLGGKDPLPQRHREKMRQHNKRHPLPVTFD